MSMWVVSNVAFQIAANLGVVYNQVFHYRVIRATALDIELCDNIQALSPDIRIQTNKNWNYIRIIFTKKYLDVSQKIFTDDRLETLLNILCPFHWKSCSKSVGYNHSEIVVFLNDNLSFDYPTDTYNFINAKTGKWEKFTSDFPFFHYANTEFELNNMISAEFRLFIDRPSLQRSQEVMFSQQKLEQMNNHIWIKAIKVGNGKFKFETLAKSAWAGFLPEITVRYLWKYLNTRNEQRIIQSSTKDMSVEFAFSLVRSRFGDELFRCERFSNSGLTIADLKDMLVSLHEYFDLGLYYESTYQNVNPSSYVNYL